MKALPFVDFVFFCRCRLFNFHPFGDAAPEVSDELKAEIAEFRKASVTCRNPCCLNPNEQVEPLSWSQYVRALCGSAKHG